MKSKTVRIVVDLMLVILGIVFLVFGIKDAIKSFSQPIPEDNVKFSRSYTNVPTDNIYKYINSISEVENSDNIVVFIGNPKDAWSQVLAPVILEIAKDTYDTLYYLEDSKGKDVPKIIIIKNNEKKVYNKNDLIDAEYKDAPIEYWTDEKKSLLSSLLL